MWMAELARRSGLSVATIKFYLREGLLDSGERAGATRSRYDESHLRRLRLIQALTDVGGLRLEAVRQVLAGIADASSPHDAIGAAHTRLAPPGDDHSPPSQAALDRVDSLLRRHGWELAPGHPQASVLASSLDALDGLGHRLSDEMLDAYASALGPVAELEVASVQRADLEATIESAVIGTVLQEPILLAIRRIAQENVSRDAG